MVKQARSGFYNLWLILRYKMIEIPSRLLNLHHIMERYASATLYLDPHTHKYTVYHRGTPSA